MRTIRCWVSFGLLLLGIGPVHAEEANSSCRVLSIGLSSWPTHRCNIEEHGKTLTLSWLVSPTQTYRVDLVLSDDGQSAEAAWNGIEAKSDVDKPLGRLTQSGDCWTNDTITLCFARPGHGNEYVDAAGEAGSDEPEIAQEIAGDEEEAERATANEATPQQSGVGALAQNEGSALSANASSFRGLQLGMTRDQIAAALNAEFSISDDRKPAPGGKDVAEFNFVMGVMGAQAPNGATFGSSFLFDRSGKLCGEISFAAGRANKMRFSDCYFGITEPMLLKDFAQQIIDTYALQDGMAYNWQSIGSGAYRFEYYEYSGVRHASSERFTVAVNDLSKVLTLTVEPIQSATFN